MKETRTFISKELEGKELLLDGCLKAYKSWYAIHTDTGGWTEHELSVYYFENKSLRIHMDSDLFLVLLPEQAQWLSGIITAINKKEKL